MIFHGICDDSLPHPSFRSHLWAGRHFRVLMLTFALIWLVMVPTVRGWGLPRPAPHETKESPWHYLTLLFFLPILSLTLSLNSSSSWPPNSLSSRINNQWAAALEETLVLVLIVTSHTNIQHPVLWRGPALESHPLHTPAWCKQYDDILRTAQKQQQVSSNWILL